MNIKMDTIVEEPSREYLPTELKIDSRYNVRPFAQDPSEAEDERIEELARSMEEVGQLEAVLVTPDLILIAGHRRRRAAIIINGKKAAQGAPLMRLRVSIVKGGDLWRKSIVSNIQRESLSPMDIAYLIKMIRENKDWRGSGAGTKRVAAYLGVSYATVAQHERFCNLAKEIQNKLHDRSISAQSALQVMNQFPDTPRQIHVLNRASEIQAEMRVDKIMNDYDSHRMSAGKATEALSKPTHRTERPAVLKAIREHCTTAVTRTKAIPLSRNEVIQSFDSESIPEPWRSFFHWWSHEYVLGRGDRTELLSRLLAILPKRKSIQSEAVAV